MFKHFLLKLGSTEVVFKHWFAHTVMYSIFNRLANLKCVFKANYYYLTLAVIPKSIW